MLPPSSEQGIQCHQGAVDTCPLAVARLLCCRQRLDVRLQLVLPSPSAQPGGRVRDELPTLAAPVRRCPSECHRRQDLVEQRGIGLQRLPGLDRIRLATPPRVRLPEHRKVPHLSSFAAFGLRLGGEHLSQEVTLPRLFVRPRARRRRCARGVMSALWYVLVCSAGWITRGFVANHPPFRG